MLAATAGAKSARHRSVLFFVGSQAATPGKGIVAVRLDENTGALELLAGVTEVAQPTWLLADPGRAVLYSVSEVGYAPGQAGDVLSFAINQNDGRLTPISRVSSGGSGPTFIGSDRSASMLFVAHYGDGKVAAIPVSEDGALSKPVIIVKGRGSGPHQRQDGPHAHAAVVDPSGRFVIVPDFGADRIFVYRFDLTGRSIAPAPSPWFTMPAGSGPRHLVFGRDGRTAFVITELQAKIHCLEWDSRLGVFTALSVTELDRTNSASAPSGAEIGISDNGRFVYASERSTSTIQVFEFHAEHRTLHLIQTIDSGGLVPRSFALSPKGNWMVVANQGSNQVTSLRIDRSTGRLLSPGNSITVNEPVAIAFAQPMRVI